VTELPQTRLRAALRAWRDGLIDLGGRNRLLHFRQMRVGTLEIRSPEAEELLARLDEGLRFAELPEEDPPAPEDGSPEGGTADASADDTAATGPEAEDDGIVTQKTTRRSLEASLRRLYNLSNQVFNDSGLWVLQLGVGFLRWREPGAEDFSHAPLLLVPVRLERIGPGEFLLISEEGEESTPNPALAVKMEQLGLRWPAADDMKDPRSTMDAVRAALSGQDGWQVDDDVVLAVFHSHKEAMYRDLLDNEERILAHPMVRAMALGADAGLPEDALYFDPVPPERIDEVQPPERIPLVLDADSSQRQCVAAAVEGRSFVMDGPPGTGKSQTIANMIAALLHAGRTVLFVSEKAAALDVVRKRLEDVGLGSFLLALHSHHASRKEVARELGDAVLRQPKAENVTPPEERDRAERLRRALSAYATSMNEVRHPLDRTLHDIIGRVARLGHVPALTVRPVLDLGALDAHTLREILDAATAISDTWRPAVEGDDFAWRGLVTAESPLPKLRAFIEETHGLARGREPYAALVDVLGADALADTGRLVQLLDHTAHRPPLPAHWLAADDFDGLTARVKDFTARLNRRRQAIADAEREIGPGWERLTESAEPPEAERALAALEPEGISVDDLTAAEARRLADDFEAAAELLDRARSTLADVAAVYGVPAPRTVDEALALCELCALSRNEPKPDPRWLHQDGRAAARRALDDLQQRAAELAGAEAAARDMFTPRVLDAAELPEVARRFTEVYKGVGKLSGAYRADRRFVAALTHSGKWDRSVAERLGQAVAWHRAYRNWLHAVAAHAEALGGYGGDRPDLDAIRSALATADSIAALASEPRDPARMATQLALGAAPDAVTQQTAASLREELRRWRDTLVPAPHPGGRPRLTGIALPDAIAWYRAHPGPLRAAAEVAETVDAVRVHADPVTVGAARQLIGMAGRARVERSAFDSAGAADRELLGGLYAGADTDTAVLDRALEWALAVRRQVRRPLPEDAARIMATAAPDQELALRYTAWKEALRTFLVCFELSRQSSLAITLNGPAAEAIECADGLTSDPTGPDEWHAFGRALEILRRHGLDDLVGRAVEQRVPPENFRETVERAVLEAWVEHQLTHDERLKPVLATERDRLIADFQELDRLLVSGAAAQVIDACNARRPRPNLGQTAILQREAEKKSRHKPVRRLLEETRDVVPLLKPCFMMSPLTVSRFLPPDFRFDMVIFDEASQVLPQDAINCVYRADALIVAGDQKQLPPTSFFSASEEEDDEYDEDAPDSYESLLDLCKGSGLLRSLSLNWHYRSRHEDLIAFSNHHFYGGALVTFPGARHEGDDVGVTFTKVAGVYDRGRTRANAVEAAEVARRVLHHYTTRPKLSLGVVALSDAQARAIEDAVEEARLQRPDLDPYFTAEDRLDGFFVKNLETVQGDERDVIILSVGYGPDRDGHVHMNFGPINRANGWRRLNVAVTRARYRVEVVSSLSGAQIREGDNKSLNYFKSYLDYAERGPKVLAQRALDLHAAPESPFEESVLGFLLDQGYDVQPQVGVGAYRIDLAVRHPQQPGRFVLGIECDGAMYHSAKAARDRDRLREQVLRGLGWQLHRIWGTDWYRNRGDAQRRLIEAIDAALARPAQTAAVPPEDGAAAPAPSSGPAVTMQDVDTTVKRAWAARYRKARFEPDSYYYLHEPEVEPELREFFRKVLEVEAPVHREVLYRRAADEWGNQRIGSRIRANLEAAVDTLLERDPDVLLDGDFLTLRGREVVPRSPGDGVQRGIAEVSPEERRRALLGVIEEAPGISLDDLLREVASFFGWQRLGPDIRRTLTDDVHGLAAQGAVEGLPSRIVRQ